MAPHLSLFADLCGFVKPISFIAADLCATRNTHIARDVRGPGSLSKDD